MVIQRYNSQDTHFLNNGQYLCQLFAQVHNHTWRAVFFVGRKGIVAPKSLKFQTGFFEKAAKVFKVQQAHTLEEFKILPFKTEAYPLYNKAVFNKTTDKESNAFFVLLFLFFKVCHHICRIQKINDGLPPPF